MTEPEAWAAHLPPHEEIAPMDNIDTSTAAIAKLMDGVTPGPWRYDDNPVFETIRDADGTSIIHGGRDGDLVASDADARFIAAARALVPALSAERDDLRAELDAAVDALDQLIALNDDYSPFGGELFQDRVDRTWRTARATVAKIKGADHE